MGLGLFDTSLPTILQRRDTVAEEEWSRSRFTVKLPADIQPEFHFQTP